MKLTTLIEKLEKIKEKYGDLPILQIDRELNSAFEFEDEYDFDGIDVVMIEELLAKDVSVNSDYNGSRVIVIW